MTRIVALAGGVGGAKLADGLAQLLLQRDLTLIVNTGDDFEHLGLHISPDLDTICYTLAGRANPVTGWGRMDDTWLALESLGELGGPTWFQVGDRDLGLHLERTRRLHLGETLSQVTAQVCHAWGIQVKVLPMSDDFLPTWVYTEEGEFPFQEYFVHRQCQPRVRGFRFAGIEQAQPAPGVLEAIEGADLVIICPSNPWVSIGPILAVPGIRHTILARRDCGLPVAAISPIICGQALKGPAAKMYAELGIQPSALAVAQQYGSLISDFIFDEQDRSQIEAIQDIGVIPHLTDTIMKTPPDRQRLARQVITFCLPT